MAVGAVWSSASVARSNPETVLRDPEAQIEYDVEFVEAPAKASVQPKQLVAHTTEVPAHQGRIAGRGKPSEPSSLEAPAIEAAPSTNNPETTAPDEYPSTATTPSPSQAPIPGIDGKPIWAVPGVMPPAPAMGGALTAQPAPVVPAPPPASTGALATVMDYLASGNPPKASARIEPPLHFPAAGTLASALASEVRGSSTPPNSNGIFELVINAQGQLVSVQVLAAAPEYRPEWDRVAKAIAQRFLGQTFPLPTAYAGGSRVRVAVTSQMTMPDGTAHGIPAPAATIPGLPNEKDIKIDGIDDPHRGLGGRSGLPPTSLAAGIKFDFDLANIAAKPRRIVRTRITASPLARATSQGAADPRR